MQATETYNPYDLYEIIKKRAFDGSKPETDKLIETLTDNNIRSFNLVIEDILDFGYKYTKVSYYYPPKNEKETTYKYQYTRVKDEDLDYALKKAVEILNEDKLFCRLEEGIKVTLVEHKTTQLNYLFVKLKLKGAIDITYRQDYMITHICLAAIMSEIIEKECTSPNEKPRKILLCCI